jgi:hypothetical protein
VLHVALLVTMAVQLVQADRLVGTTAFWLTRPIPRGALLAAKLGVAATLLVGVPIVVDAIVLAGNGLAWLDALGAVADGAWIRLAVVLPVMVLAAMTGDLAVFVVAAIATLAGSLVLQVAIFRLARPQLLRSPDVQLSLTAVSVGLLVLGSLAALAHQVFTRRTAWTARIALAAIVLTLVVANRWTVTFLTPPRVLEPGRLDPGRVSVTLEPLAPDRLPPALNPERPWRVRARAEISGGPPNILLAPFWFSTTLSVDGRFVERYRTAYRSEWNLDAAGLESIRKQPVEHVLGGAQLLGVARTAEDGYRQITALTAAGFAGYWERGGTLDVETGVGALAYETCPALALEPGVRGRCGNRQIRLQSADYRDGRCLVVVRDVMAGFAADLRRPSHVAYLLVNRARRQAAVSSAPGYDSAVRPFGRSTFTLLAEHIAVTHHHLVFQAPKDVPDAVGPDWLRDAVIVPLEVRDIGQITVRTKVAGRRD